MSADGIGLDIAVSTVTSDDERDKKIRDLEFDLAIANLKVERLEKELKSREDHIKDLQDIINMYKAHNPML